MYLDTPYRSNNEGTRRVVETLPVISSGFSHILVYSRSEAVDIVNGREVICQQIRRTDGTSDREEVSSD